MGRHRHRRIESIWADEKQRSRRLKHGDPVTDRTFADYTFMSADGITHTAELIDTGGNVIGNWSIRQFSDVVVTETYVGGKLKKSASSIQRFADTYFAREWADNEAKRRNSRVPTIRSEKAEAKIESMLVAAGIDVKRLTGWTCMYSSSMLFMTDEEMLDRCKHWDIYTKDDRAAQIKAIFTHLTKVCGNAYKGIKTLAIFIDQMKKGGLVDQIIDRTVETVEKNLIPWAYVAGFMHLPVMLCNEPRKLAAKLAERYSQMGSENQGFFKPDTTIDEVMERIYRTFIEDVKPEVLDAMTLEL